MDINDAMINCGNSSCGSVLYILDQDREGQKNDEKTKKY